jgi:HEAT repeat protein
MYEELKKETGRHDFEVLKQMATVLLEQGIRSPDLETQLLSLFGAAEAGLTSSIDILEEGLKSPNFETQMASIQFLSRLQDDRCDELLTKAMSSDYIQARLEAGFHLSMRKHRKAAGQIESLMIKVPDQFRFYFPQFFALIGTTEAISILRHLIEDPISTVRVEAILSAARLGRDDLLGKIRMHATHPNHDEQEACAYALGLLSDSKSIPQLKKLSQSSTTSVRLAALHSLYLLGVTDAMQEIEALAKQHNLFAITLLGDLAGSEKTLFDLTRHPNKNISYNAAIALTKRRDPRALPLLEEILIHDSRDLGFQPQVSLGHTQIAWKVIPSLEQHAKNLPYDLRAISLQLRESLLLDAVELPEADFLHLAHRLFETRQYPLIPFLTAILENHRTESAIRLLKQKARAHEPPHIRLYASLALCRLGEIHPYQETIKTYLTKAKSSEMIRFRSGIPFEGNALRSHFELTPEENSGLLIEAYKTFSDLHSEEGIDALLLALKEGHPKNRYLLAGLLIRAIQ